MKRLLLLSLFSLSAPLAQAQMYATGWETGNAGDTYAAEFRLTAQDVVARLKLLVKGSDPAYDTTKLEAAVGKTTTVTSEDHVMLNGDEVDAANWPAQHKITVNRSRWKELRRPTETKGRMRTSLHEFLFIAGTDDTGFVVSDHLIELIDYSNYSPDIWWNPVNPTNYLVPTLMHSVSVCDFQNLSMDVAGDFDSYVIETKGECSDFAYRRVQIVRWASVIPPTMNVRGMFQRFALTVFNKSGDVVGAMQFEPTWGQCLVPDSGSCRASGRMTVGGVQFEFWFMRNFN